MAKGSTGLTGGGGGSFKITTTPKIAEYNRTLAAKNRGVPQAMAKMHKELGDIPVAEIEKKSAAAPRGQVRIGKAVRASASRRDLIVNAGGSRYPDFAGQEWGSKRYRQFAPFKKDGYVIGAVQRDQAFMADLQARYATGLNETLFGRRRG